MLQLTDFRCLAPRLISILQIARVPLSRMARSQIYRGNSLPAIACEPSTTARPAASPSTTRCTAASTSSGCKPDDRKIIIIQLFLRASKFFLPIRTILKTRMNLYFEFHVNRRSLDPPANVIDHGEYGLPNNVIALVPQEARHVEGSCEAQLTGVGQVPRVVDELGPGQRRDVHSLLASEKFSQQQPILRVVIHGEHACENG